MGSTVTICGNPFNNTVTVLQCGSLKLVRRPGKGSSEVTATGVAGRGVMGPVVPFLLTDWLPSGTSCQVKGAHAPDVTNVMLWLRDISIVFLTVRRMLTSYSGNRLLMIGIIRFPRPNGRQYWHGGPTDTLICRSQFVFANNNTLRQHLCSRAGWKCLLDYGQIVFRWARNVVDGN